MNIESVRSLVEVFSGDTRNAMHSILGFLELLSEGHLDAGQREFVETCRGAANLHMRGMEDICLVLGLVPEKALAKTDFAPLDLFAGITEIGAIMAGRKGTGFASAASKSIPPTVSADADRIGHALLRVTEAVIGAIDGGDIHLNLAAAVSPRGFNLTFEILAPQSMLTSDLIRALDADDFEFDSFLSGGGALTMAAARTLVTSLGGSVDASAGSTQGIRIEISIPVGAPSGIEASNRNDGPDPNATAREGAQPNSSEPQSVLRILVAEDSESSFQLFKAYLRGHPHSVTRASNGAEAVEMATAGTFDLLFMDISMPVMDGYAATRRIRELETGKDRPRLPIVVLSAEDLRAQRRRGALIGCSGYLSKPLRKQELLEAIHTYSAPNDWKPNEWA